MTGNELHFEQGEIKWTLGSESFYSLSDTLSSCERVQEMGITCLIFRAFRLASLKENTESIQ